MRSLVLALLCGVVFAAAAFAQDNVIARARALAAAGNRAAAISILQDHLKTTPNDVDARLIYGLVLSWDGKYDDARRELTQVLTTAPEYLDARVALMNVELWSGNADRARDHMRLVLAADPGNTQARLVRQRLNAKSHPWFAGARTINDWFSDDRDAWHELWIEAGRETGIGPLILRGDHAERFGLDDQQLEVDFYPVFRAGTYAYVNVGIGAEESLYPSYRWAFDLYQSLGRGYEISGGARRLEFSDPTTIYVASLSKYLGNWMITAKTSMVPEQTTDDAWSYFGTVRYYFGDLGTSFVSAGYSHGYSREEPRGEGDLVRVDDDTFRAQADLDLSARFTLSIWGSTSRQHRDVTEPLWQTTLSAGFTMRF